MKTFLTVIVFVLIIAHTILSLLVKEERRTESEIDGCLKTLYVFELSAMIRQQEDAEKIDFCQRASKTFKVNR